MGREHFSTMHLAGRGHLLCPLFFQVKWERGSEFG